MGLSEGSLSCSQVIIFWVLISNPFWSAGTTDSCKKMLSIFLKMQWLVPAWCSIAHGQRTNVCRQNWKEKEANIFAKSKALLDWKFFFLPHSALLLQFISVMSRLKTFQLVHPFLVFAANYQFQCSLFVKPIFSALTAARQWWKSPGLDQIRAVKRLLDQLTHPV